MFHHVRKLCARRGVAGLGQRRGYGAGETRTRRCPSCGLGLPTALPVCPACRYVGRVKDSITHHELLGLPYGPNPFVVDTGELKRRFLDAQRLCHPDAWATRSEDDKGAALAMSNAVNTAYKTLLSPMERIGYVLRRHGKGVGETEQVEDAGLIAEVMEVREAVEGGSVVGLGELKAANDDKTERTLKEIEGAVEREDWAGAVRWAVRLKYLLTIEDAIRERAENAEQ